MLTVVLPTPPTPPTRAVYIERPDMDPYGCPLASGPQAQEMHRFLIHLPSERNPAAARQTPGHLEAAVLANLQCQTRLLCAPALLQAVLRQQRQACRLSSHLHLIWPHDTVECGKVRRPPFCMLPPLGSLPRRRQAHLQRA